MTTPARLDRNWQFDNRQEASQRSTLNSNRTSTTKAIA